MTTSQQTKTLEQTIAAIQALDLEPIKFKLMARDGEDQWSQERADMNELGYRRFLILVAKYPGESIAPNKDVDKFWHGHILDTMKYAQDCQATFGFFLHHFPYLGMRDEEDAEERIESARLMDKLSMEEFGESCYRNGPQLSSQAAYSGTDGLSKQAAYSGTDGLAKQAAYSGTDGLAKQAAYSGTDGLAKQAAYSGTDGLSKAKQAAYSGPAVRQAMSTGAMQVQQDKMRTWFRPRTKALS